MPYWGVSRPAGIPACSACLGWQFRDAQGLGFRGLGFRVTVQGKGAEELANKRSIAGMSKTSPE